MIEHCNTGLNPAMKMRARARARTHTHTHIYEKNSTSLCDCEKSTLSMRENRLVQATDCICPGKYSDYTNAAQNKLCLMLNDEGQYIYWC